MELGSVDVGTGYNYYAWRIGIMGATIDDVFAFDNVTAVGSNPESGYDRWALTKGVGATTNDFDSDGLNNLYEYGLDGNPTNALNQGTFPSFTKFGSGFTYVHPKRSDDASLVYTV